MIVHTVPVRQGEPHARHVLLHLAGVHQLPLCRHFFTQLPDTEWVVLIECPPADILKLSEAFSGPANVTFAHALYDVILRIDLFSAVVTTLAIPHRAHYKGLLLYTACSQLGIPCFELQHGMFQIGINYRERARIVGDGYYGAASTLPVSNFHDALLAWSGDNSIGYPTFFDLPAAGDEGYCLILSNLHWNIYGEVDQTLFFETVLAAVEANPDTSFVWKPHPAEISKRMDRYFKPIMAGDFPNLSLVTNDDLVTRGITTEDLIRDCAFAISSFSSVLLDLEMYGKKVAVYSPAVCAGLQAQVQTCSTFVTPRELLGLLPKLGKKSAKAGRFTSGLLNAFAPGALRAQLAARSPAAPPAKADVARVIVPLLQKLL